jgi:acetyl-CoA carboxylase biotin carboxyl carrier protein
MIDLDFLERLIRAIDASGIDSVEIERGGTRIRVGKTPPASAVPVAYGPGVAAQPFAAAPLPGPAASNPAPAGGGAPAPSEPATPAAPDPKWVEVKSPMVGTFYLSPAPDAPAYVDVGKRVGPGDTLCIIEAMKLMNELEAEVTGSVVEVCVKNGEPVEYGQVLFRIDPS